MKNKVDAFKEIGREYIITSKELKEKLGIKGKIISLAMHEGLSPKDEEEGKSHDEDTWSIITLERFHIKELD